MGIFDVFMLFGGIALFLFGMNVMSAGLEKTAGGRLEKILQKATSNPFKAFLLGIGITSAIQSSSAVTVMLVGLVNSGIMQLHQTVGVIMGTNIGTTVTAWILSLTGLQGSSFIIKLLKPDNFSQLFAVAGIVSIMFSKRARRRNAGEILLGFAVLMAGMAIMRNAVSGLESSQRFREILTAFSNPVLGVLFGALVTAVIQSSSASVGILQVLAITVSIPYMSVIPIIMGQNIGTCVTAILSSFGANKNAKRVAAVHIYFNIIGTVVFLAIIYAVEVFADPAILGRTVTPAAIAIIHSVFNVATTLLLFPFAGHLEKLAKLTVKGKPGEETKYEFLDDRLLTTPTIAVAQCHNSVVDMGNIARKSILRSLEMLKKHDEKSAAFIRDSEESLDEYEDNLNTFLIKLSGHDMTDGDSWKVSELLHIIGDLERLGDHALSILESAEEIRDKDLKFTSIAKQDMEVANAALTEIINMTFDAFERDDIALAGIVEPLGEAIDHLVTKIRSRHIARLQNGECLIVPGFVWSDLLVYYKRVTNHCLNIAICVLQSDSKTLETHGYLSEERSMDNPEFVAAYNEFKERFKLR